MATYSVTGMLHSDYEILEAKLNGNLVYKQSEKYVEYTVDAYDEYICDYESWLFPSINRNYQALIYVGKKIYGYSTLMSYTEDSFPFLANEIDKIRIYYPDDTTEISFSSVNWLDKIIYIYTDDSITVTYK